MSSANKSITQRARRTTHSHDVPTEDSVPPPQTTERTSKLGGEATALFDDGSHTDLKTFRPDHISSEDETRITVLLERYNSLVEASDNPRTAVQTTSEEEDSEVQITILGSDEIRTTHQVYTCECTAETNIPLLLQSPSSELGRLADVPKVLATSKAGDEPEKAESLQRRLDEVAKSRDMAMQEKEIAVEELQVTLKEKALIKQEAESLYRELGAAKCRILTLESESRFTKQEVLRLAERNRREKEMVANVAENVHCRIKHLEEQRSQEQQVASRLREMEARNAHLESLLAMLEREEQENRPVSTVGVAALQTGAEHEEQGRRGVWDINRWILDFWKGMTED